MLAQLVSLIRSRRPMTKIVELIVFFVSSPSVWRAVKGVYPMTRSLWPSSTWTILQSCTWRRSRSSWPLSVSSARKALRGKVSVVTVFTFTCTSETSYVLCEQLFTVWCFSWPQRLILTWQRGGAFLVAPDSRSKNPVIFSYGQCSMTHRWSTCMAWISMRVSQFNHLIIRNYSLISLCT